MLARYYSKLFAAVFRIAQLEICNMTNIISVAMASSAAIETDAHLDIIIELFSYIRLETCVLFNVL